MSKICYATVFAVVLVGCSRQHKESDADFDATQRMQRIERPPREAVGRVEAFVMRNIQNVDKDTSQIFRWDMLLYSQGVDLSCISGGDPETKTMSFSDPKEATDTLAKFVEWDEKARQNKVEPFTKPLTDKCTFQFAQGRSTLLEPQTPKVIFAFSRADVDKFNELLKQLPEAQAELEAKIAKAKKEKTLFK